MTSGVKPPVDTSGLVASQSSLSGESIPSNSSSFGANSALINQIETLTKAQETVKAEKATSASSNLGKPSEIPYDISAFKSTVGSIYSAEDLSKYASAGASISKELRISAQQTTQALSAENRGDLINIKNPEIRAVAEMEIIATEQQQDHTKLTKHKETLKNDLKRQFGPGYST